MDEEEPNCNICFESFDDEEHSPRTLRCGHTLCTPCINVLVKRALPDRVCPECRKTLKISNATHLPISYTILRLSRALAKAKPAAEVQVQVLDNNTCMKHGAPTISWCPLSDKWHCFKCVHSDNCDSLLSVPEAFLHIKQNYSQVVVSKLSNANNLSDSLEKEKETLQKNISSSERGLEEIAKKLKLVEEWTKRLETDEAELVEAATTVRLTKSLKRLKRDVADFDSWLEKSQPSVKSRIVPALSTPASSSPIDITALKEQLDISQAIYAVHESELFETRWAKLSLDGYYLLMYALEYSPPPQGATLIPFQSVLGAVDKENAIAFFEIECQSQFEGRVYFEMLGNTPRGQQFQKLCTAEEGACYRACKLMEFEEVHHRYVRGGLIGDNIYAEPIVEGITDGGIYRKVLEPGLLNGWKSDSEYWALCDIVLECKPGYEDDYVFGKVLSGLSVLKGVCENNKTKKTLEVQDCGVVVGLL